MGDTTPIKDLAAEHFHGNGHSIRDNTERPLPTAWQAFDATQRRAFIDEDIVAGRSVSLVLFTVIAIGTLLGVLAVSYAI